MFTDKSASTKRTLKFHEKDLNLVTASTIYQIISAVKSRMVKWASSSLLKVHNAMVKQPVLKPLLV
jgi:hypothetical protein